MLSDFERRAWETRTRADKHKPEMALKAALDQIERGELTDVRHICIVYGRKVEDDATAVGLIQAGDLSEHASEGMMARAIRISQES